MLRDSVAVACTRPRAIPLAMIIMRKSSHGFPFACHMGMGLRLAAGAPLELNISLASANILGLILNKKDPQNEYYY